MHDHQMAEYSAVAYKYSTWDAGSSEALFVEDGGEAALVPRGTELNGSDILRDVAGWPWPGGEIGFVHYGFLKGARRLWTLAAPAVLAFKGPVHVGGHSKGGGEGHDLAGMMCLAGKPPASLVTFGSPRNSYDDKLARLLAAHKVRIRRYVRGQDAVTMVPWLMGTARHVGDEFHLEVKSGSSSPFGDHKIAGYVRATRRRFQAAERARNKK